MIKKKAEQHDDLGFTEWWELPKNYLAIIFLGDKKSSLVVSDELRNKFKPPRPSSEINVIYPILIKEYNLSESEYILEQSPYGNGILNFSTKKKEELLIMLENLIYKYSFFDDK